MSSYLRSLVAAAGQSFLEVKEVKLFINRDVKMGHFSYSSEL